ncbi:universal stress protein [Halopseudomonas laoshanensis]|nr:universal stress protein [Halopseudomonas laoshanensis]
MSPIIVATDLNPESDLALSRASAIARELDAPLIVMHTVDDQLPLLARDNVCKETRRLLEDQLSRCVPDSSVHTQLIVSPGRVAESTLRLVSEERAQLLVLGKHHQRSPERVVYTTAERVSRLSCAPVLTVATAGGKYQSALLALDFSACASEALRCAARLLDGGRLHALHVCNPPLAKRLAGPAVQRAYIDEQSEMLDYLLKDELETLKLIGTTAPQIELQITCGEMREQFDQAIAQFSPGFVALGSHSRDGLTHALRGSLAQALLRDSPCDVLIAH